MALEAGVEAAAFWGLTPWQTRLAARAGYNRMVTLAWHIGALSGRTKMPKLDDLLRQTQPPAERERELMDFMAGVGQLKKE